MKPLMVAISLIIILFDRDHEGKWVRKENLEDIKPALMGTDLRKITVVYFNPVDEVPQPYLVVIGPEITKQQLDDHKVDIYEHWGLFRKVWDEVTLPKMVGGTFIKWCERIPAGAEWQQGLYLFHGSEEHGYAPLMTLPSVHTTLSELLGCQIAFDADSIKRGARSNPYRDYR